MKRENIRMRQLANGKHIVEVKTLFGWRATAFSYAESGVSTTNGTKIHYLHFMKAGEARYLVAAFDIEKACYHYLDVLSYYGFSSAKSEASNEGNQS